MERSVLVRAGLGAIFMGAGLALMLSATRSLADLHEISPEATATEVAEASAGMHLVESETEEYSDSDSDDAEADDDASDAVAVTEPDAGGDV